MTEKERKEKKESLALQWFVGGIGLLLTLALIGFIGWKALTEQRDRPPDIALSVERIVPISHGYVAEIVAHNSADQTASAVDVEGILQPAGTAGPEKATATFDYVPGGSETRGGLYFTSDPRAGRLELRVLGYSRP